MSLAVLTLGLLTAPPVQAQSNYPGGGSGGGYPGGGSGGSYPGSGGGGSPGLPHSWTITYTPVYTPAAPTLWSFAYPSPIAVGQSIPGVGGPEIGIDGPASYRLGTVSSIDASLTGSFIATLTWVPTYGQTLATDPPSEPVYIAVKGLAWDQAYWGLSIPGPSTVGSADDGLGDPAVSTGTGTISQGTHLIQCDGSSGTITVGPVTLSAASPASAYTQYSPYPGYNYTAWNWTDEQCLVAFSTALDPRRLTLSRDMAHNETTDADGTVHGDTRYSYSFEPCSIGPNTVINVQYIHPKFSGNWSSNPSYQWTPQAISPYMDMPTTHPQVVDIGSIFEDGTPPVWAGPTDARKTVTISYTATDTNGDGGSLTANYILTYHDQYENWHRVSSQGGPIAPQAAGDPGSLSLLGTATTMPGTVPSVTYQDTPVEWVVDGLVGGGVVAASGVAWTLIPEALDPPTWPAAVLTLAGLTLQTTASLPPDTTTVSPLPCDQFNTSFLQQAYENYLNGVPGEQSNTNLVDTNFAWLLKNNPDSAGNPDFAGYAGGDYAGVTITSTLYEQMLNYYFQADKYDNGGKLPPASASVSKPGGCVWCFLWHCHRRSCESK